MKRSNTEITYLYRDASNYKFWGSFVVSGRFYPAEVEQFLFDREFFVPQKLGIPSLTPKERNEDDHDLHTFESAEPTEVPANLCSSKELARRIEAAHRDGWFELRKGYAGGW